MALAQRVRPTGWDERTSGTALYTTDVQLPDTLTARVLRSPHPHADIRSIDTARARSLEGVAAVVTAADFGEQTYLHLGDPFRDRSAMARNRVRFVGEEVAAVAAETEAAAAAALRLIEIDYKPRPATLHPPADARGRERSHRPGAARPKRRAVIHDHAPDNVAMRITRAYGNLEAARAAADVTVTGTYNYPPAAHVCLEPHSAVARWDPGAERLCLWLSTQAPYFVRKEVAHMLGLRIDQVRTHPVAVGGGFGAKAKAGSHEVIAAALAMRVPGRPVRLVLDRAEEFAATAVRHPFRVELTTGASSDGRLTHREGHIGVDNGAYNHAGPSVAVYATMLAANLYRLEGCETTAELVYTNRQPPASFRGYGNPQMTFAMESQIDELAGQLGIDRIDLRLRNACRDGDVTLTGWRLGTARLAECLERARAEIGWDAKQELAGSGQGVGVAAAIHVSGANAFEHSELSEAAVDVLTDGTARVRFAGSDAGTGQATLLRQIASHELGIAFDDVSATMMDSHNAPLDLGAWSSRGTVWGGHATADASRRAAQILKRAAAEKFGSSASRVRLVDGEARYGADAVSVGDLVALTEQGAASGQISAEGSYLTDVDKMDKQTGRSHFTPAYGICVQAVEVKVDRDTGEVRVTDVVSVHDSGAALNPAAAQGQVTGAVAMGLGAALGEELVYEQGRLVNPSLAEYAAPRAADLPAIRAVLLDGYDSAGPYGAKGLGEIGLVPTPAAVANAVAHATGVRVRDLPITPDKLRGFTRARASPLEGARPASADRAQAPAAARPRSVLRRPRLWWTELLRRLYPLGVFWLLDRCGARGTRRRLAAPALAPEHTVQPVQRPATVAETTTAKAVAAASDRGPGDYIAGGTDLLVAARQGLRSPVHLIDVTSVRSMRRLRQTPDGGLSIGAAVTLEDLRRHVLASDPAEGSLNGDSMLADLLKALATHQIRELATVGGNLLQQKRCSFYRNGFPCYKRGGWKCPCYAVLGDHRFQHAVIGGHRCQAVTPSDLATGLLALGAAALTASPSSGKPTRHLPIGRLYKGPGEPALAPGELLTAVEVSAEARARRAAFEKLAGYSGDFAVCSAAVSLRLADDGHTVAAARIALGAVAPVPYRARRSERRLIGASLQDTTALAETASAWAVEAHPLPRNAWKVDAASGLLRRTLMRLTPKLT